MSKSVVAKTEGMPRKKWLELRKHGIGGSDAAAVCGMNRWRGPLDVYMDKMSKELVDHDTEAMYWGRCMEPVLRDEFAVRTGLSVEAVPYLFRCKEFPFMLADIDGIVHEKDGSVSLLELKTAGGYAEKDWTDGLPQEYFIQIQHYLAVVDLPKAYVAVLIGGNQFRIEEIPRDDETIQTIIALENDFWHNHILAITPPAVDATSGKALDTLYPESNGTSVILGAEADAFVNDLESLKEVEAQIKISKDESENALKALLGEAECGKTPDGYSVRWKSSTTSRLDTAKLKVDHPDLVAKYTKTTTYRRFSITAPKKEAK